MKKAILTFGLCACTFFPAATQTKKANEIEMDFTLTSPTLEFREAPFFGVRAAIPVEKMLESIQTPFQKIEMFKTPNFGNMMVIDNIIMLTQFDNHGYHEMITHIPMQAHPNPRRVLIVGGGDGGVLTEVLKYDSVEQVVMCEIDSEVIRLSKKYFPEFADSFDDPRAHVIVEDAGAYIKNKTNYFDVIICDSTDNFGPAAVLFQRAFYVDLKNALSHDGIAATQSESIFYHRELVAELQQQNKEIFAHAAYYYTMVPTYPSGMIGFSFCSKKYDPFANLNTQRVEQLKNCQYYNEDLHRAAFKLPEFIRVMIEK